MQEPPDITQEEYEKAANGLIPWTAQGLREALDLAAAFATMDEDELPEEFLEMVKDPTWIAAMKEIGGTDPLEAAKMMVLIGKYADEGYLAAFAYHIRLLQASTFLSDHFDELVKLGLIDESPDGEGATLSDRLLEALAVLPFSETKVEDGETFYEFSFAEVVARARKE